MKETDNNRGSILDSLVKLILIAAIIAATIFLGIKTHEIYRNKMLEKSLKTAHSIEEVAELINSMLSESSPDSISIMVEGVSESELEDINRYISTTSGSIESFEITKNNKKRNKVKFIIRKNETTYVYDCLKNGTPIPGNNEMAIILYNKIKEITGTVIKRGMTDYQKELALHDYLVSNCTYGFGSPDDENEFRAYGALIDCEAVCSGYTEAMTLLLTDAGIKSEIVIGDAGNEHHAWNMVYLNDKWYHLDATWDDPKGMNIISHAYFNISDDEISKDHSWIKDHTRTAADDDMEYFNHSGLVARTPEELTLIATNCYRNTTSDFFEVAISDIESDLSECINDFMNAIGKYTISYSIIERTNFKILIFYK